MAEQATVVGPQVSLGQVADVIGENKAVVEKIRRVSLGKAALAGKSLKITLGYLKIALRRDGFSLKDFSFEGTETAEVLTQSRDFFPSELLPQVKSFVVKELGESPQNVEVKFMGVEKKITLPAGDVKTIFRPALSGKYEGTLLLTTELEVDGRTVKVLPLRVLVEVFHPVVVTKKMVEKGERFTNLNVGLSRKPTSLLRSGSINELGSVIGRTAAVPVISGTILRMTEIYDPPVIKRGQVVQAVVRRGNVEITVQSKAIEDGKAGDKIRVENTATHKVLNGKVLDEKTVLMDQERP